MQKLTDKDITVFTYVTPGYTDLELIKRCIQSWKIYMPHATFYFFDISERMNYYKKWFNSKKLPNNAYIGQITDILRILDLNFINRPNLLYIDADIELYESPVAKFNSCSADFIADAGCFMFSRKPNNWARSLLSQIKYKDWLLCDTWLLLYDSHYEFIKICDHIHYMNVFRCETILVSTPIKFQQFRFQHKKLLEKISIIFYDPKLPRFYTVSGISMQIKFTNNYSLMKYYLEQADVYLNHIHTKHESLSGLCVLYPEFSYLESYKYDFKIT